MVIISTSAAEVRSQEVSPLSICGAVAAAAAAAIVGEFWAPAMYGNAAIVSRFNVSTRAASLERFTEDLLAKVKTDG
jgi:hypothetical protein